MTGYRALKRTCVILILMSWMTSGRAQDIQPDSTDIASALLGEAADLDLPFDESTDDGRGSAAAGWNRRLAGLDADERFALLSDWSMPTESRRTIRVLTAITPTDAPPAVFARALGERPRRDSFATLEIGEVQGLFCSASELIKAADEAGKLRGLTTELARLVDDGDANARFVLLLAKIKAARRFEQPLLDELTSHAAAVADRLAAGGPPSGEQPALRSPAESDGDLALAAACLTKEWLRPIGEQIYEMQLAETYDRESRLMRPFLRQALATAIRKRYPDAMLEVTGTSNLDLWAPSSGTEAARNAQGAVPSTWLSLENQVLHLAGPRSDYLFLKYPLTGEFEFSCEAQIGGRGGTDGGVGYGGLGYELWGAQQLLKVWTASHDQVAQFEVPFVANNSLATFNRFSLKSNAAGVTLSCNGHSTWTETADATASPWVALRCYGSSAPVFRKIQLAGDPVIPREVRMSDGDSLRGWVASYYGERIGSEDADWVLKDEVVYGKRADTALDNPQSRLYYLRPLLSGESISYEFQYEPGRIEVHPALGRMAFVIEPDSVRLHWLTDGDMEWTGLAEDNAVAEPLNRRGPRPSPLKAGEWNVASVELENDTLTLSLNGTVIYVRKMEPDAERTFGLYHDKNRTEARVRNVVMRGDWPEKLTRRQLDNLAAADTDRSKSERRVLGASFDDRHIHGSVLEVPRRAAAMQVEQRYQSLSDWVLPSDDHETLRLAMDFTPTNPGPPAAANGGELVAPALELVAASKELGRLQELQDRVALLAPRDEEQQRARSSMLALIATASGDFDIANQHGADFDRALTDASSAVRYHRVHVAGTFDGETVQVFVNGKLEKTSPVNGRFTASEFPMMIAASPSPREGEIDFPFDGLIDQVRISSTVRYTKDFTVPREFNSDESTLALFRFDEGKGETLGDASGHQIDGRIRGAQWVTGDAIRHRAALGLVAFGRFAVPFLTKALGDENPSAQLEAIAALATIGPDAQAAVTALTALADDADERVRRAASQAVTRIESKGVERTD